MRQYQWTSGESYQRYVGRWSRLVAAEFVTWLGVPSGARWLDVGCGTGALSRTILEHSSPKAVTGIDSSSDQIEYARDAVQDPRVTFVWGAFESWESAGDTFDVAVSGLVLNFLPDAAQGVARMKEAVRDGGLMGVYVWDYAERMDLVRYCWDAAYAIDPDARAYDESVRFPICHPDALHGLFTAGGLRDVETRHIEIETRFADFDDYWTPFLSGLGPAPGYVMSLGEVQRAALRERIRSSLPVASDGSISLSARAWAVKGVKMRPK